ncbi:UDP-N-acetylmuramoyl-tripeptide--D-alanyl-D-alanine ligase [Candidatus Poribacteria bacterium]|nr:UDP-N-acetylmuramoyl-tripeptide--D-alanyl-D-alanine ligase [Candidatus Poribacteria bacterium]
MEKMTISESACLFGGNLLSGDPSRKVSGVSTDSRAVGKGELFLALKGDRFDGHDFAEAALNRGAEGVVGESGRLMELTGRVNGRACLIAVSDTLSALHSFARGYRSRFDIPLVAVTGSCGKTTTKDMLGAILSRTRETVATEGNLNNLIGAPLTLLRIGAGTQAAVIEIATNAPGEIGRLARTVSPTAGIITNIGPVHLEGLGSIEGVFNEKCSLVPNISPSGFLVIHEEDIPADRVRSMFGGAIVTFGLRESADFHAAQIRQEAGMGSSFLLNGKDTIRIPVVGEHNVVNALAAIAAAVQLGVSIDDIRSGLAGFSSGGMRMEFLRFRGATIINDAYNANPRAMRESISTVMAMPARRRILVIGDMLELGEYAHDAHHSLGQYIGQEKPDLLYVRGEHSPEVRDGALESGMQPERVYCCAGAGEIAASLRYILGPDDLLLVKGSRGMRMEEVIEILLKDK